MRYRPLIAGAAALALALSLTACGDDDGEDASTDTDSTETTAAETTEAETETTEAETETTEAETETTEAETETETTVAEGATDLAGLLVMAEDVGAGFTEQPYETSTEPGPCGISIDEASPYDDIAGTVLGQEELQLFMQHEIRAYADAAAAAEAMAAAQEGFGCGAETTEPGVMLGEVTDVTGDVGGESAFGVEVTAENEGISGALIAVQVGPVISVYQFQGPDDVSEGPDVITLISDNVAAIETALA
jgi:hypothetical protein